MDRGDYPSAMLCKLCGDPFALSGGVYALQEDSRIIGVSSKVNKTKIYKHHKKNKQPVSTDMESSKEPIDIENIEKMVDEALDQAEEKLAQLENIHKTLTSDLEKQLRERARLEVEIKQVADKASQAVQQWKDVQLSQLTKLEAAFSGNQEQVCCVQERIKTLEFAMQMGREVRHAPVLGKYCSLDTVLETLQAPVENQALSSPQQLISAGPRMSYVFQSSSLNQNLSLYLKMEFCNPECFSQSPPKGNSERTSPWQRAENMNSNWTKDSDEKFPRPRCKINLSCPSLASDLESPDVIIEDLIEESEEQASPPTCSEMDNDKRKKLKRRKNQFHVTRWVVVTHIVNPSHFYIRSVAEWKENQMLSEKINHLCCGDNCQFTSGDTVEAGSLVFVQWKEGLWCRSSVVEVWQSGCAEAVNACPVDQVASIRVFLLDNGLTKTITVQSVEGNTDSPLKDVNKHLRKVDEDVSVELSHFAPQAVRCSLRDLVPYDLTKGWTQEAQLEFHGLVGSAPVEMRFLGQDNDSLLVDLRKPPMDQSSGAPISIRDCLVFTEVARFYTQVTLGMKPLLFYPPTYPKINTELSAVVSHINDPTDFYIQLGDNVESSLLSAKLQECYSEATGAADGSHRVYCPAIGQAYTARRDQKLWCRAQVIGHPAAQKVEVRYVDYGNRSIVSVSDLRKIKDEFLALPSMAIHSCLSEVVPLDGGTWSTASIKRFTGLTLQKPLTIVATETVCKTRPQPVKLFQSSLSRPIANIAELLIKEELACSQRGFKSREEPVLLMTHEAAIWDPPLEQGGATACADATDQAIAAGQEEEPLHFEPQLKLPTQLEDLKVRVSHITSPGSFHVQLTENDSQLRRVCELLKQQCALTEAQDAAWKPHMYCAAHVNGVWERGRVCSDVTAANTAEVMRCDHGNKVTLHVSNLRPLPSSLMGCFALECTLSHIRPAGGGATWTATACDVMTYYLTGASAVMTIQEWTDERPLPVTLFCCNKMGQFISIADFLVSEGLALRERKPRAAATEAAKQTEAQPPVGRADKRNTSGPSSPLVPKHRRSPAAPLPPKPAPRTIMSAVKVKTGPYNPPELSLVGLIQVKVSAVGEDGLIYTRTQNAEYQLVQLALRIQQSMKSLPQQKRYTWKSVLGCAVMGRDMTWYRGQLLEVMGGHVKVQYVDYGLVENIPADHVYPMLLCEDVPQLCMSCRLHGINPLGGHWQCDALALLEEMLLNRSLDMQILELPSDPRQPVPVELFLDGLNLNRILCHHQHATVDQSASAQTGHSVTADTAALLDKWDIDTQGLMDSEEPVLGPLKDPDLPQEGECFEVRVKHLLTPNKLFLSPLDGTSHLEDGETLDQALDRVNADIDSLSQLRSFPHGGLCLAEYSDGRYYRAQLIHFISTKPILILVRHVDFGSDDALPPSKMRQMPLQLLKFPLQVVKVKVAGYKAPSGSRPEEALPYSPRWSVKAAMEMVDLLPGDITAMVVSREPELTVLLFNDDRELVHLPLVRSGLAELE